MKGGNKRGKENIAKETCCEGDQEFIKQENDMIQKKRFKNM